MSIKKFTPPETEDTTLNDTSAVVNINPRTEELKNEFSAMI